MIASGARSLVELLAARIIFHSCSFWPKLIKLECFVDVDTVRLLKQKENNVVIYLFLQCS